MAQEILKPLSAILVDRTGELEAFFTQKVDVPTLDVVVVNDSNAMRKKMEKVRPDLIFFSPDFAEPGLVDFVKNFRKTPAGAGIYLILFTDKNKKELMARAFEAGVDEFITVPFITAELLAKVKLLVKMKNIRLDLAEKQSAVGRDAQLVLTENAKLKERVNVLEQEIAKDRIELKRHEATAKRWETEAAQLRKEVEARRTEAADVTRAVTEKDQFLEKIVALKDEVARLKALAAEKDDSMAKLRLAVESSKKDAPPPLPFLDEKGKAALESSESAMDELERLNRLRKYLSPTLVERIITAEATKPFGSVAKRRHATFLFVDIRDLTQFADDLEPRLVTQLITETFNHILEAITNYGGTVNKFFGDSIMAVFNDPVPVKDHAMRAMQAANRIKHLALNHQERPGLLRSSFHVAVAVHTGQAVFGNFGTHHQIDYTAVGRDVTLTARLLGFSSADRIIVTKDTYEPALPQVVVRNERREAVKGFEEPIWIADLETVLR